MWVMIRKLGWCMAGLTAVSAVLWLLTEREAFLTLTILLLTLLYHTAVRMLVANAINARLHNHADYRARWFRVSDREMELYRRLKVRKWKDKVPTYDPESFNAKTHSWDEIAQTTCQSELVHETNLLVNLVPLLFARWVGRLWLFLSTSLLIGGAETLLIVMQRFNRGRIVRLLDRQALREKGASS